MSSSMMYKETNLKDTQIVGTSLDKFYLGVESKDTKFDLMTYQQAIKI